MASCIFQPFATETSGLWCFKKRVKCHPRKGEITSLRSGEWAEGRAQPSVSLMLRDIWRTVHLAPFGHEQCWVNDGGAKHFPMSAILYCSTYIYGFALSLVLFIGVYIVGQCIEVSSIGMGFQSSLSGESWVWEGLCWKSTRLPRLGRLPHSSRASPLYSFWG